MFRRIVFTAALAGLIGGLVLYSLQSLHTIPLIYTAETYEKAPVGHPASPNPAVEPAEASGGEFGRGALTAVSHIIAAIGFALILTGAISLRGGADFRRGLLWGLGGFAAFSLAPSLGLPPELPGTAAAGLGARQAWWIGTVAATAGGLALIVFAKPAGWKSLGAVLIALPHLIGAPHPDHHSALAPESLQHQFVVAALATSAVFWLALGGLSGYFFRRFENV